MNNDSSTETPIPIGAYYDEKTLEMARKMIQLSMQDNNMARGLLASAYSFLLLNRLVQNYFQLDEYLPFEITEKEGDAALKVMEQAQEEVLSRTGDIPLKDLIQQLVKESKSNRKLFRKPKKDRRKRR